MNPRWNLENAELFSAHTLARLSLADVLVDFDGPQVAIWKDGREQPILFFGVAADSDESAVRWLLSLTDTVELDALFLGAVSVRDVLLKDLVLVVDVVDGAIRELWRVSSDDVAEDFLPTRHALLPKKVRQARLAPEAPGRTSQSIRIGHFGKPADADHQLEFNDLAKLLAANQRLWTATGQVVAGNEGKDHGSVRKHIRERTTLFATSAHPGSFVVDMIPADPEMFVKVGEQLARVVAASDDPEQLPDILKTLRKRVTSAYASFLETLEKRKLNVLTSWSGGSFYLGAGSARRIRHAVLDAKFGDSDLGEFTARGYFLSFTVSKENEDRKSFRFYDEELETEYEGDVLSDTKLPDVTVGSSKSYEVTLLEHSDVHGSESYLLEGLVELSPVGDLSLTPPPGSAKR